MNKKIRIGFVPPPTKDWMGGVNYYKNLFFALNTHASEECEIFVFVPEDADSEVLSLYEDKVSQIVRTSLFKRKSFYWFIHKIISKFLGSNYFFEKLFSKYKLDIVSHSAITNLKTIKCINWISDFQHHHLPHMFSDKEIRGRNNSFLKLIMDSDAIWLSSRDALNDFTNFVPSEYHDKAKVLQFVSQPEESFYQIKDSDKDIILKKYGLPEEFFFLPNQFWKHKNHMFVFEAVKQLKNNGKEICVVCTGKMKDYRHQSYIDEVSSFVKDNNLTNNIKLLGLIDYADVYKLINFSKVVINPSLFEGWSSTVEECKSVGKQMVLSNINIHKEQYPESCFFDVKDLDSLIELLLIDDFNTTYSDHRLDLDQRTKSYSDGFINVVREVLYSGRLN